MVTEDGRHRGQHLGQPNHEPDLADAATSNVTLRRPKAGTSPLTWLLVGSLWHSPNSPDSDRIQTFPGFINFGVPNLHTKSRQRHPTMV